MGGNLAARIGLGIVCCCCFGFAALLLFYAVHPWIDHKEIPFFDSRLSHNALFGAVGLICTFVTVRLIQGRPWAWWTAFAVSTLILSLGMFLLYSSLHPRSEFERSESGFGIGISIILIMPTFVSSVLLLLPSVRRRFLPS
jgi:hypothetical protein